jgi:alpha-glucosidase/alpha-D-xyloside xylohydrolase
MRAGLTYAAMGRLLFHTRLQAASLVDVSTGQPGRLDLSLAAITPRILRISIAPVKTNPPAQELGILPSPGELALLAPEEANITPSESATKALHWGKYSIRITLDPLRITVSDASGRIRQEIQFDTDSTDIRFRLGDRPLFGLGSGFVSLDRRGARDRMVNGQSSPELRTAGARVPIPWLLSPEGWGLFIGQPFGAIDLTGPLGIVRSPVATSTRNVYLVLGDSPAEVLAGYADLTGHPHMPPLWSLGYLQSHRTLASREEVLDIARTFREKQLPCDALIYLGTGFCPSGWNTGHGSFTFNESVFPDPPAMFRQFHEQHFHVALHVVPPYNLHGTITDSASDAQAPGDAVPYWAKHQPIEDMGVDGWWPDEGDLLSVDARLQRNALYWDGPLQAHPQRRPFALHRNGYAGLQRYGWIWSGDVDSTWKTLAAQVKNGINMGLCGIPYWGTDTGGFVPTRELTPELYLRWFQFSAFCPLFRSHGRAWKLRLPWGWNLGSPGPLEGAEQLGPAWPPPADLQDTPVEPICRKYLELRYQLLPYLYSTVAQAHATGLPLMRALWLAWPDDPKSLQVEDQYLWGDHFLVSPILEKEAKQRTTYLPAATWWDYWTSHRLEGGREVTRDIDLATLPLYVRAGSILPMGPVRQYTAQPVDEPDTLLVYPGADGRFRWYDDDGASFAYQQRDFTALDCRWNDTTRKLTLAWDSQGKPAPGKRIKVRAVDKSSPLDVTLDDHTRDISL